MRALVIYTRHRPIAVIVIPDHTPVRELDLQRRRLDEAGLEYEVLAVSRDTTLDNFIANASSFIATEANLCGECGDGPDGVPDPSHGETCSLHPANLM